MSLVGTLVEVPPDIEEKLNLGQPLTEDQQRRLKLIEELNAAIYRVVARQAKNDLRFAGLRFGAVIGLAFAVAIPSMILVWRGSETWLAAVGAVSTVGVIAAAGWVIPLHTIERDIVIRRWSDIINSTYLLRIANEKAGIAELAAAGRDADRSFELLAANYAAIAGKSLDHLPEVIRAAREDKKDDEGSDDEPAVLSVKALGTQRMVVGKELGPPIEIEAKGPGKLTFEEVEGRKLPTGLKLDAASGKITGAPETEGDSEVEIRVSSDAKDVGKVVVAFTASVTKAEAEMTKTSRSQAVVRA